MINQYDIVQLQDGRIAIVTEVLEPEQLFLVDVFEDVNPFAFSHNDDSDTDNDDNSSENSAGFTIADLMESNTISEQIYVSDIVNIFEEISLDNTERNDLGYGR